MNEERASTRSSRLVTARLVLKHWLCKALFVCLIGVGIVVAAMDAKVVNAEVVNTRVPINQMTVPVDHLPLGSNDQCTSCHDATAWLPVRVNHADLQGNCASCHDNTYASGKSPLHFATSEQCVACHTSDSWEDEVQFAHNYALGRCISCHNGQRVMGRSATHLTTTEACSSCHNKQSWGTISRLDHLEVLGACESCHNGQQASGMPTNHMMTTTDTCETCHETNAWRLVRNDVPEMAGLIRSKSDPLQLNILKFSHTANNATTDCARAGCHDGGNASGQFIGHIATTNRCEACHRQTSAWVPARMDHAQALGTCTSCHNSSSGNQNSIAAVAKPPNHIPSTDFCERCHNPSVWVPVLQVDHSQVLGTCIDCHDGGLATGKQDVPVGKPDHIASSDDCEACHTVSTFVPAKTVDHNEVSGSCSSCHLELKTNSTIHPETGNRCQVCHSVVSWRANIVFDHGEVSSTCINCHKPAAEGGTATPIIPNHIPTTDECGACHNFTVWRVVEVLDHGQVASTEGCVECHNGSVASGKNRGHILIKSPNICDACHSTDTWVGVADAAVDHAQIEASCSSCHNSRIARGKSPVHIPTIAECDECHDTQTWFGVTQSQIHSNLTQECVECHSATGGNTAKGFSHIPTTDNCQACHTVVIWRTSNVEHLENVGDCITCHDGVRTNSLSGTVISHKQSVDNHIDTSDVCEACHLTTAWAPDIGVDHQEVIGPCVFCHGAESTIGKIDGPLGEHIESSEFCEFCHSTLVWVPAKIVNHDEVVGACVSCHDGVISKGKLDGLKKAHIETSVVCEACHSTLRFIPATTVDHNEIIPDCITCHDGSGEFAKRGVSVDHIDSTDNCSICHGTIVWRQIRVVNALFHEEINNVSDCQVCHRDAADAVASGLPDFHVPVNPDMSCGACHLTTSWLAFQSEIDHAAIGGECVECHNGTSVKTGKSANHIPSTGNCKACHRKQPSPGVTVTWTPIENKSEVDHAEVLGIELCSTCHNGVVARGKEDGASPKPHITTTDNCEGCHVAAPQTWNDVPKSSVDHDFVMIECADCHNSQSIFTIDITPKNEAHISSSEICSACHSPAAGWTAEKAGERVVVDHSEVNGLSSCGVNCHDGNTALGPQGRSGTAFHINFNSSNNCSACHSTVSFAPAITVDHNLVEGVCNDCHNGTVNLASGGVIPGKNGGSTEQHIDIDTSESCAACHSTTRFKPRIKVDHSQVAGNGTESCLLCHDGSNRIPGYLILGKEGGPNKTHIVTTEACELCHITTNFIPAVTVNHTAIDSPCIECHDGKTTSVRTFRSPRHIETTTECQACHDTAPKQWLPSRDVNHNEVKGVCESCHDGVVAVGKIADHIPTTDECVVCHLAKPTPWAEILTMDHGLIQAECFACHNNVSAVGKESGIQFEIIDALGSHVAVTNSCNACHSTVQFIPAISVDHNEVSGLDTCFVCHSGTYQLANGRVIPGIEDPTLNTNGGFHIETSNICGACHNTQNFQPIVVDHNEISVPCANCHAKELPGGLAQGLSDNHIPILSDNTCDACHSTTKFVPIIRVDHAGVDTSNCAAVCHKADGLAIYKSSIHILTSEACDTCHSTRGFIPAITVNHNETLGACFSCHDSVSAIGPSVLHIPIRTESNCGACHSAGTGGFIPTITVDHAEVDTSDCSICHYLNGPGIYKSTNHIDTSENCGPCHATTTFVPSIGVDHNEVNGIDNCGGSCHDGVIAVGVYADHPLVTARCGACHNPFLPSFASPFTVDHNETIGTCESCHPPPSSHSVVNVISNCDNCHDTVGRWADDNSPPLPVLPLNAPADVNDAGPRINSFGQPSFGAGGFRR